MTENLKPHVISKEDITNRLESWAYSKVGSDGKLSGEELLRFRSYILAIVEPLKDEFLGKLLGRTVEAYLATKQNMDDAIFEYEIQKNS